MRVVGSSGRRWCGRPEDDSPMPRGAPTLGCFQRVARFRVSPTDGARAWPVTPLITYIQVRAARKQHSGRYSSRAGRAELGESTLGTSDSTAGLPASLDQVPRVKVVFQDERARLSRTPLTVVVRTLPGQRVQYKPQHAPCERMAGDLRTPACYTTNHGGYVQRASSGYEWW